MKNILLCLTTLFLTVSPAAAHDGKEHKEPMVEGTLTSLTGDKASLKTEKENLTLLLVPETKFEFGMEGKAAKRSDVKTGQYLMVHGRKIGSGEFQATEVMIHDAPDAKEPDHKSMDHSK